MSKLQLLAQKRKLEKLQSDALPPLTPHSPQVSKLQQKRANSGSSALASLLARKKALGSQSHPQKTGDAENDAPNHIRKQPSPVPSPIVKKKIDQPVEKDQTIVLPGFNRPVALKHILEQPTHLLPQVLFANTTVEVEECVFKRRKIAGDLDTNIPTNIAVKIKQNFQTQSPDEKRQVVENLSEKISDVKIEHKEPAKQKKKVSPTKPKNKIDVAKELSLKSSKPLLSTIVIGHVDSGKSTTIGRMLYDLGVVDSRTLHKLTKDAELAGKGSFSLAWVMDQTPEERSRGVTVDIVQTQFETDKMRFAIIDSPGHRDYVPQMINGVTQADFAVVIIDSTSDLIFEAVLSREDKTNASLSEISKGQTFEQLLIAKNLGIDNVLLVLNKMDVIDWDQDRFITLKDTLTDHLTESLGFAKENLRFLPASGFNGDNIVKKSNKCKWYDGPTLFETLEQVNEEMHKSINELTEVSKDPFALTITDIQSTADHGSLSKKSNSLIVQGRVNSGTIQPGETVRLWPSDETAEIDSVTTTVSKLEDKDASEKNNEKIGTVGEFIELKLRKLEIPDAVFLGDLMTKVSNVSNYDVECGNKLTCELRMFGLTRPVLVGTPFVLFKGPVSYSARLASIEWVESKVIQPDGTTKLKKSKKKKHLSSGQRGKVVIETEKLVPVIKSNDGKRAFDKLQRIVIRKEGMTIGAGKII